jgi:hypothetical protein
MTDDETNHTNRDALPPASPIPVHPLFRSLPASKPKPRIVFIGVIAFSCVVGTLLWFFPATADYVNYSLGIAVFAFIAYAFIRW